MWNNILAWLINHNSELVYLVVGAFFLWLACIVIYKVLHFFDKVYEKFTKDEKKEK